MIASGQHSIQHCQYPSSTNSPKFLSKKYVNFQLDPWDQRFIREIPPWDSRLSWRWPTNTFRATWNDGYGCRILSFPWGSFFIEQSSVGKFMLNNFDFWLVCFCVCVCLRVLDTACTSTLAIKSVACADTVSIENIGQSNSQRHVMY